jgi:hypothetical protein
VTAPHGDQIVAGYIAQLERALASVPPSRRAEIVDEIGEHIAQVRGQIADESDADVLNLLDRLGDPVELAASAPTEEPTPVMPGGGGPLASGWLDIAALVLTPILWPVGVILLWMSPSWSTRDKLIGTLVPPGAVLVVTRWVTPRRHAGGSRRCREFSRSCLLSPGSFCGSRG